MAKFHVGQMVLLRSGKRGAIQAVTQDHELAALTAYRIALEPDGQSIIVDGLQVIQTMQPNVSLIGQTLDEYRLTGISYGADSTCEICRGLASDHEVFETELSQAAAMEVLALLMQATDPDGQGGLKRADRETRFMFGVLIAPGRLPLVAASGSGETPESMKLAVASDPDERFALCGAVVRPPLICRGGREIDPSLVAACQEDNTPLACAAPKLVDRANRLGYTMPYHMTEVWFDPKAHRRRLAKVPVRFSQIYWKGHTFEEKLETWLKLRDEGYVFTEHGETRESCDTCKGVLPMLLCNAQA